MAQERAPLNTPAQATAAIVSQLSSLIDTLQRLQHTLLWRWNVVCMSISGSVFLLLPSSHPSPSLCVAAAGTSHGIIERLGPSFGRLLSTLHSQLSAAQTRYALLTATPPPAPPFPHPTSRPGLGLGGSAASSHSHSHSSSKQQEAEQGLVACRADVMRYVQHLLPEAQVRLHVQKFVIKLKVWLRLPPPSLPSSSSVLM